LTASISIVLDALTVKQINLQNCQLSKKKRSVSTAELEFGVLTKSESNVTTGSMLLVRTKQDLFGMWT